MTEMTGQDPTGGRRKVPRRMLPTAMIALFVVGLLPSMTVAAPSDGGTEERTIRTTGYSGGPQGFIPWNVESFVQDDDAMVTRMWIKNVGGREGRFAVRVKGWQKGYQVSYHLAGRDVTAKVRRGTLKTSLLKPGKKVRFKVVARTTEDPAPTEVMRRTIVVKGPDGRPDFTFELVNDPFCGRGRP
jgi:hypothetical protein